ncbi:MAG: hypothetical protein MK033_10540 [Candidatus Caenarcaniphilales bacterium]|nr:hypothetical protein [Candidatus Caenarcaniphilales bacterium]
MSLVSDTYLWIEKTSTEGVGELSSIVFNTNTLSKVAARSLNQSGERLTNIILVNFLKGSGSIELVMTLYP